MEVRRARRPERETSISLSHASPSPPLPFSCANEHSLSPSLRTNLRVGKALLVEGLSLPDQAYHVRRDPLAVVDLCLDLTDRGGGEDIDDDRASAGADKDLHLAY